MHSNFKQFLDVITRQVRGRWLLAVLAVSLTITLLSGSVLAREDAQTLFFPLILVALLRIAQTRTIKLPGVIVVAALMFWLLGASNVRAFYPNTLLSNAVYISRLQEDADGVTAKGLSKRVNDISSRYSLPRVKLIQRTFTDETDARSWLDSRPNALLLASGTTTWLRLSLPRFLSNPKRIEIETDGRINNALERTRAYQLGVNDDIFFVTSPQTKLVLLTTGVPNLLELPLDPPEPAEQFLAWLASGISAESSQRELALLSAARIQGPWKSAAPQGLAYYLAGTQYLLDAVAAEEFEFGSLSCAYKAFRKSLVFANDKAAPKIVAAALNNAAVATVYDSGDDDVLRRAQGWLGRASKITDSSGQPVPGARAAMVNLELLSTYGL